MAHEQINEIRQRLANLDQRGKHGAWTYVTLRRIADYPGQPARELADIFGRDQDALKLDIRKLKNRGLTRSLDVGYDITRQGRRIPRGGHRRRIAIHRTYAEPSRSGRVRWTARRLKRVIEVGRRKRSQPAPPHAVFEALTQPDREAARPWLQLLEDEQPPQLIKVHKPALVVWSSLWSRRPDTVVRFDLPPERGEQGTDLCWTLLVNEPVPGDALVGHMRKRLNQLINANLRYAFGQ